jgi:hypothetical protein
MAKLPTINETVSGSKRTKCGCCGQVIPTGQRFVSSRIAIRPLDIWPTITLMLL